MKHLKYFKVFESESEKKTSNQVVMEFSQKYPEHANFFQNFVTKYPTWRDFCDEVEYFFQQEWEDARDEDDEDDEEDVFLIDPTDYMKQEEVASKLVDDYPEWGFDNIFSDFWSELTISNYNNVN